MPKGKKSSKGPRGIDESTLEKIQEYCDIHNCPKNEIIELIKFALAPPPLTLEEMPVKDIKTAVASSWNKANYDELRGDAEWKFYHKSTGLSASRRNSQASGSQTRGGSSTPTGARTLECYFNTPPLFCQRFFHTPFHREIQLKIEIF